MEEDKKKCPFCGKEININAKKCRFCNNWLDEDIECPFCAEKIKASAKKCRFCGEWLPQQKKSKFKFSIKNFFTNVLSKFSSNNMIFVLILVVLFLGLFIFGIYRLFIYIPSCTNSTINKGLISQMKTKFKDIKNLSVDKTSIEIVSKDDNGYTCKATTLADDETLSINYSYKKVGFRKYSYDINLVLPDCYDNAVKNMLSKAIVKQDYLDIKNITSDVEVDDMNVVKYEKDIPCYKCSANVRLTAKPGQAYVIGYDYYNANNKASCNVEFKNTFCDNGYTNCVVVTSINKCKYDGEKE